MFCFAPFWFSNFKVNFRLLELLGEKNNPQLDTVLEPAQGGEWFKLTGY